MKFQEGLAFARELDKEDPLSRFREAFCFPKRDDGTPFIYLCGNSLGLQPKNTARYVEEELDDWRNLGVEGHFRGRRPWYSYHEIFSESIAKLVGAKPVEVVVMNGLTVNLHLLMTSFYRPTPERYRIVMERSAFPSDQYAVASQVQLHGFSPEEAVVELGPRPGEDCLRTEDVEAYLREEGQSVALILMGGVNYYSGQAYDMKSITQAGHNAGALVAFDLAHAAGNIELRLHEWDVDFAAFCTYKYLNAGPGATAGAFVHERFAQKFDLPRLAGWWGNDPDSRFQMTAGFVPQPGAAGWQLSNAPVLSMAPLRASLDLFDEAGMDALRDKSEKLTAYLWHALADRPELKMEIITPAEPKDRGCQLSLRFGENTEALFKRLEERGVICDFRRPDVIRVAPVPLYNSFEDLYHFATILREAATESNQTTSG